MRMTPGTQSGIAASASGIVLCCHYCPVVDGCSQPVGASLSHLDATGFAAPFGDRSNPGQRAQGVVVSLLDGLVGLCEQRGEDDPSHPRQGAQDRRVALLGCLPRLGLRSSELLDEAIEATGDVLDRKRCGGDIWRPVNEL